MPFNRPPLDLLYSPFRRFHAVAPPGTYAVLRAQPLGHRRTHERRNPARPLRVSRLARAPAHARHGGRGTPRTLGVHLGRFTQGRRARFGRRFDYGHARGRPARGDDLPAFGRRPVCRRLRRHRRRRRDGNRFPFRSRRGQRWATPQSEPFSPSLPPFPGSIRRLRLRTGLPAARTKRRTKA